MKTIFNSLIALLVFFMNSESFAGLKSGNDETSAKSSSSIPVSPRDWSSNSSETPEFLKFLKAKAAFVPVAEFVWGNPDEEVPVELKSDLRMVPVPSIVWDENSAEVPESIRLIKAKNAGVPMPAKIWTDKDLSNTEISILEGEKDRVNLK